MNKEQRKPYFILTSLQYDLPKKTQFCVSLCAWCKHADWLGSCMEAELDCLHPLEKVREESFNAWEGGDCWGFRPAYLREDCVDIVGLYLQGKYVNWETVKPISIKVGVTPERCSVCGCYLKSVASYTGSEFDPQWDFICKNTKCKSNKKN